MKGRVALVTGSGKRRVGWYVADALGQQGYSLAIHYRTSAEQAAATVREFGTRGIAAAPFQADLTDEEDVRRLVQDVADHFGRLDVLVNCAAIWECKPLEEVT